MADADPRTLTDCSVHQNFTFELFDNKGKDGHRNHCRYLFTADQISINESCEELIYQLRNGNLTKSGDFQRSIRLGHCDLISALIILCRIADLDANPFPPDKIERGE